MESLDFNLRFLRLSLAIPTSLQGFLKLKKMPRMASKPKTDLFQTSWNEQREVKEIREASLSCYPLERSLRKKR